MTQKARSLGMNATVFKNAHGLPHPEQITTARDMVTLALRLNDDFPRYYGLFATRTFSYDGETYRNHNTLLGRFEGTDGIKTGYTAASGFNLVSSVRRDGKHIVGAVFGGRDGRNPQRHHAHAADTRAGTGLDTQDTQASARRQGSACAGTGKALSRDSSSRPRKLRSPGPRRGSARPMRNSLCAQLRPMATEAGEQRMPQSPRIDIARVRPVLVAPRARTVEPTLVEPVASLRRAAHRTRPRHLGRRAPHGRAPMARRARAAALRSAVHRLQAWRLRQSACRAAATGQHCALATAAHIHDPSR